MIGMELNSKILKNGLWILDPRPLGRKKFPAAKSACTDTPWQIFDLGWKKRDLFVSLQD